MIRDPRSLRRGLVAVGVGSALVAAVPVALLASVGNPLPTALPTLAEVSRVLTRGEIAERTLIQAIACVCWLAWAQLVAALAVEAVAALRGRPARRLTGVALFQGLAAALVAAAVPLLTRLEQHDLDPARRPLPTSALADDPSTPPSLGTAPTDNPPDAPPGAQDARKPLPLPAHLPRHLVARRQTLWHIAEERLGDPYRWREIFDLNAGRPMPDGGVLQRPDEPLREGWVLALPADARPGPETDSHDPAVATRMRHDEGADVDAAADLIRSAQGAMRAADDAEAEWRSAMATLSPRWPSDDDPLEDLGPPAHDPDTTQPVVDLSSATDLAVIEDAPVRPGSLLDRLGGAGLLAGGLVWTLDRIRRSVERRRLPDAPVATPPDFSRRAELGIRAAADLELVRFVDLALRAWGKGLARAGRRPPEVVGVNVAEELSLLFSAPDPSPVDGFEVEDGGFSWVTSLRRHIDTLEEAATCAPPLRALFTLGHTDRSQVLLNAEALDVVVVAGPDTHVAETLFAMAVELATGPWAGRTRVVAVGFGQELAHLPNVKVATTLDEVAGELEVLVEQAADVCRERGVSTAVEARIRGLGEDAWTPTVVLAAGLDAVEAEELAALAARAPATGVSALIAGDVRGATWRIEVTETDVTLHPVGVTLRRHHLPSEACAALDELFALPARPLLPARRAPETGPDVDVDVDVEPDVEVCVLGPVSVAGAGDFARRKALELVAYLALHRRGVDGDALAEALWPDRLVSPRTLHGIASTARRTLGRGPDGAPVFPHAGSNGRYWLPPSVGLDAERFSALVGRATGAEPQVAASCLSRALELVRGRPFTVPGEEYLWVHAEALMTAIVAEVADAAHQLACLYLEAQDPRGAWWATQQGLLASPGNEQLHRDRMLAADLAGNPAGVEEVMEELCRAVEIDRSEMREVLHPMTVELYDRLARRTAARSLLSRA